MQERRITYGPLAAPVWRAGRMYSLQAHCLMISMANYIRLRALPTSQAASARSSFADMGCPAGVADAWTLACKGLEGSDFTWL